MTAGDYSPTTKVNFNTKKPRALTHAGQTKGQRNQGLRTCEEGRAVAAPIVLEPVPAHDHAAVVPIEVRDPAATAGGPLGLPEENRLILKLLWVRGGVGNPTLDEFIIKRECAVDEFLFFEMFLEVEATHHTAIHLFRVEVELVANVWYKSVAKVLRQRGLILYPALGCGRIQIPWK